MKKIKEQWNSKPHRKQISKTTKEKCEVAKKYIEHKYQKHFENEKRRQALYDSLVMKMQGLDEGDKNIIRNKFYNNELKYLREKRIKESILDFEPIDIIGRGAFGEVRLCRHHSG